MKFGVIVFPGSNCDADCLWAIKDVIGEKAEFVWHDSKSVSKYDGIIIPGGFSYGDYLRTGAIARFARIMDGIKTFAAKKRKAIIGICNGFQILVKSGLLPNLSGDYKTIETTLTLNDSAKFEDRWVYLKRNTHDAQRKTTCVWTNDLPEVIYLPVAHGEGKFIPKDDKILSQLKRKGLIVFEYCDEEGRSKGFPYNPNGSVDNIAGICDTTGRILGLMPHPERHVSYLQHPRWTRIKNRGRGDGFAIFENGVKFAKKHL